MNKKTKNVIYYIISSIIITLIIIECISIMINENTKKECIKKYNNKIDIIDKCYN